MGMLCLCGHDWDFRHRSEPPVIVCGRCGTTEPMPYGDARLPYITPLIGPRICLACMLFGAACACVVAAVAAMGRV
jgi:hypothetical protein